MKHAKTVEVPIRVKIRYATDDEKKNLLSQIRRVIKKTIDDHYALLKDFAAIQRAMASRHKNNTKKRCEIMARKEGKNR